LIVHLVHSVIRVHTTVPFAMLERIVWENLPIVLNVLQVPILIHMDDLVVLRVQLQLIVMNWEDRLVFRVQSEQLVMVVRLTVRNVLLVLTVTIMEVMPEENVSFAQLEKQVFLEDPPIINVLRVSLEHILQIQVQQHAVHV
jgi:hypothetical protein